jgi:hypothetical protein
MARIDHRFVNSINEMKPIGIEIEIEVKAPPGALVPSYPSKSKLNTREVRNKMKEAPGGLIFFETALSNLTGSTALSGRSCRLRFIRGSDLPR